MAFNFFLVEWLNLTKDVYKMQRRVLVYPAVPAWVVLLQFTVLRVHGLVLVLGLILPTWVVDPTSLRETWTAVAIGVDSLYLGV
jgi:hypothetical protein